MFKIKNPQGLFSNGRSNPFFKWTNKGKIWGRSGDVTLHLKHVGKDPKYDQCVVMEYSETGVISATPVVMWREAAQNKQKNRIKQKEIKDLETEIEKTRRYLNLCLEKLVILRDSK